MLLPEVASHVVLGIAFGKLHMRQGSGSSPGEPAPEDGAVGSCTLAAVLVVLSKMKPVIYAEITTTKEITTPH